MSRRRPAQTGMQGTPNTDQRCQHRNSRRQCKKFALAAGLCIDHLLRQPAAASVAGQSITNRQGS